jgi:hypothetical protein
MTQNQSYRARHELTSRQVEVFLEGGLINWMKVRLNRMDREVEIEI